MRALVLIAFACVALAAIDPKVATCLKKCRESKTPANQCITKSVLFWLLRVSLTCLSAQVRPAQGGARQEGVSFCFFFVLFLDRLT
jgi:hypothetical protein